MVKNTMLDYIVLQCRHHYLSMFLTICQPPDLTTEPATWHFNTRNNTKIKLSYIILFIILSLFFIKRRRHISTYIILIIALVKASLSIKRVILPSIILTAYRSSLRLKRLSRRRGLTSG